MGSVVDGVYRPSLHETGWDDEVNDNFSRLAELAFNVKGYTAVGDGVADDKTAIQNAINDASSSIGGVTSYAHVWLPPGDYKVTGKLTIPRGVRLVGAGPGVTRIYSTASATPILEASGTECHSVHIKNLALAYSASQTNSASIGISFPSNATNYYWWSIQGVTIANAYDGIGLGNTGAVFFSSNIGTEAPVVITESFHRAISLQGSGSPGNVFGNIYIQNSSVTPTDFAVVLNGQQTTFEYLAISAWTNSGLTNLAGHHLHIKILHVESHSFTSAGSALIDLTGGDTRIDYASLAGTWNVASTTPMFRVTGAGTRFMLDQLRTSITKSGAGSPTLYNQTANTLVYGPLQWRDDNANFVLWTAPTLQGYSNFLGSPAARVFALTDAATIAVEPTDGDYLTISTNAARTMGAPGHQWNGAQLIFDMLNNGGSGALSWNATYKLAGAWTNPANGKRRKIQFTYDGTNWIEDWRSAADI